MQMLDMKGNVDMRGHVVVDMRELMPTFAIPDP